MKKERVMQGIIEVVEKKSAQNLMGFICPVMEKQGYNPPISHCDENKKRVNWEGPCTVGGACRFKKIAS